MKKSTSEIYAAGLWPHVRERIEALEAKHGLPDVIRLNTYLLDAELQFFRPGEPVTAAEHRAAMEALAARIQKDYGFRVELVTVDTDAYFRWLDDNHLTDTPGRRAQFGSYGKN